MRRHRQAPSRHLPKLDTFLMLESNGNVAKFCDAYRHLRPVQRTVLTVAASPGIPSGNYLSGTWRMQGNHQVAGQFSQQHQRVHVYTRKNPLATRTSSASPLTSPWVHKRLGRHKIYIATSPLANKYCAMYSYVRRQA